MHGEGRARRALTPTLVRCHSFGGGISGLVAGTLGGACFWQERHAGEEEPGQGGATFTETQLEALSGGSLALLSAGLKKGGRG